MIKRQNFKPSAYSLIGSDNFEETCFKYQPFTNRRQLKRGSIPTIFVFKKKASSRRILDRCKPCTSVIFLQIEDDLSMGTKRRPIDRYFLFLVKLRTGISNEFLAILFENSDSTVSRDFNFVTDVLYEKLKLQDVFPSKDQVVRYMPPPFRMYCVAAVAEWYRYRIVACLVTSSIPVPLKTRRVGQRCTLNLSRAETSSRWCGVVVRRGGCQLRCRPRHLTMVQNYVVRRQKPSCS
ncbi:uncharacterized protein TNCV_3951621 [Trichonephila clavipes]|nr:uncharacterized protein TNCV_3951621 [Trichonephila clavipes]